MDELHTLTLHALHRKIAVKAQNRVGDKKVHESTFTRFSAGDDSVKNFVTPHCTTPHKTLMAQIKEMHKTTLGGESVCIILGANKQHINVVKT